MIKIVKTRVEKLRSSNYIPFLLGAFYFFYFAMIGVYVIFMPKVLKDLGYSPVDIGLIYTSAPLMRAILPFIFRKYIPLTDRVFFPSLALVIITTLGFFFTINNFWLFLINNFNFWVVAMGLPVFAHFTWRIYRPFGFNTWGQRRSLLGKRFRASLGASLFGV